jgi:hypothetical protein
VADSDDDDRPREIDWSTAEVRGGKLRVALVGDAPKGWGKVLTDLIGRLQRGSGQWGEIKVGKQRIEVASVPSGAEGDLRHLLEAAVLQTNAHFAPDDEDDDEENGGAGSPEDKAMTEAFRAFAPSDQ